MSNFVMTKFGNVCKNASHSACSSWSAANTAAFSSNINISVAGTVLAVSVFVYALSVLLNINLILSVALLGLALTILCKE